MNNSVKDGSDILRKYINPERIERAPEGFSGKIMARIQVEKAPLRIPGKNRLYFMVPVISSIIALTLIVLAMIFSSPSDYTILNGIIKKIPDLNLTIPGIKMDTLSGFSLPSVIIYIAIGFLILALFDRALNRVFQRPDK